MNKKYKDVLLMKETTKTLSVILALLIILSAFLSMSISSNAKDEYDFNWNHDTQTNTLYISKKNSTVITLNSITPWDSSLEFDKVVFEEGIGKIKGTTPSWKSARITADTVVLPDSMSTIGYQAFSYCSFNKINFPDGIKNIEDEAFRNCNNLVVDKLPRDLVEIGESAFREVSFLNDELVIPDEVETIGKVAFNGCNLKKLTIGKGLKDANFNAFGNNRITDLYFNAVNCSTLGKIDTVEAHDNNVSISTNISALSGNPLDNVYFGEVVTRIPALMFNNTGATNIAIPDSVTSIGRFAFEESAFKSITIPDSVSVDENIMYDSFYFRASKNLINVDFGKNVKILQNDFYDCDNMRIFAIPKNIEYTNKQTFVNCKNVKHMYLGCSENEVNWVLFREGGQSYIQNCPKTYNCEFVIAGDYRIAVSNGVNILYNYVGDEKDIVIPKEINGYKIDKIGDYTFCERNDIDSIYVPLGIKIGTCAFSQCSAKITYEKINFSNCTVKGIKNKTYNGKEQTQTVSVKDGAKTLIKDSDYTVSYQNNKNAGTATVAITGTGDYKGTITKTFKIAKAKNPMTVKAKKAVAAKAKKKTAIKNVVTVKKAQGKVTYKTNIKKISVKKGTMTVAKGLKKGKTYSVKVTVKAVGNSNYQSVSKTVTLKVKVK